MKRREPTPRMVREVAKLLKPWHKGLSDQGRAGVGAHDLAALASAVAFALVNGEIEVQASPLDASD